MNMASTKAELRKKYLKIRRNLNPDDVAKRSTELCEKVISKIDWDSCHNLHVFLPLENDNEPDLREVAELSIEKGVNVYTSDPSAQTGRKVLNIKDRYQEKLIQFESQNVDFDYIIVPMIAFDPLTNHRLGFGGGFYDRLIKSQPKAKTIGVCFKEFKADNLPVENHDVPLDTILVN